MNCCSIESGMFAHYWCPGCLNLIFMMRHTFSIEDRSGLQAGQSSTHTLCLWSHAVVTRAEWGLALSCWYRHGVVVLTAANVSPKFKHKPPSASMVPSNICRSPMPWALMHPRASQWLVFALFVGNSLGGLFNLWHVESDVRFSQKQAEICTHLTREHVSTVFRSQMTLGPETSVAFQQKIHKRLPLCIIQFQGAFFLMQQRTVLSDNDFLKYPWAHVAMSIMVALRFLKQYSLSAWWSCAFSSSFNLRSLRTEISHDIMKCGW